MKLGTSERETSFFNPQETKPRFRSGYEDSYEKAFKEEIDYLVKSARRFYSADVASTKYGEVNTVSEKEAKKIKAWMLCSPSGVIDSRAKNKCLVFIGTKEMAKSFFKKVTGEDVKKYVKEDLRFFGKRGHLMAYPYLYAVSAFGDVRFCPFQKEYHQEELREILDKLGEYQKVFDSARKDFHKELYKSDCKFSEEIDEDIEREL